MARIRHRCFRCEPVDADRLTESSELESTATTCAEGGDDVYFVSGYSAREIAQKRAKEVDGAVYVNNLSRKIRRPDLTVPVAYAVARTPVYTLRHPDELHKTVYRAYWPPLST